MPDLQQLQQKFAEQVSTDFSNHDISPYPHKWRDGIPLLFEFTQTHPELAENLFASLQAVLIDKPTDFNALSAFINYLEKYLFHLAECTTQARQANSLGKFMKELGLLPSDVNLFEFKRQDIANVIGQQPLQELMFTAYCTRNEIDHAKSSGAMPQWNADQMAILKNRNGALAVLTVCNIKT